MRSPNNGRPAPSVRSGLSLLTAATRRHCVPAREREATAAAEETSIAKPEANDRDGTRWHILLHGPTTLVDRARREHSVLSVSILARSYIPDVFVQFEHDVRHSALYDDAQIVAGVMRLLRNRGYVGPDFDRAELGMQQRKSIALEPPRAFAQWVKERFGWVDLNLEPDPEVERRTRFQG